jgi:hypothetical protein
MAARYPRPLPRRGTVGAPLRKSTVPAPPRGDGRGMTGVLAFLSGALPLLFAVYLVFLAFGRDLLRGWVKTRATLVLLGGVVPARGTGVI